MGLSNIWKRSSVSSLVLAPCRPFLNQVRCKTSLSKPHTFFHGQMKKVAINRFAFQSQCRHQTAHCVHFRKRVKKREISQGYPANVVVLTGDKKNLCFSFDDEKCLIVGMKNTKPEPSDVETEHVATKLIGELKKVKRKTSFLFCIASYNPHVSRFVRALWSIKDPLIEFTFDIEKLRETVRRNPQALSWAKADTQESLGAAHEKANSRKSRKTHVGEDLQGLALKEEGRSIHNYLRKVQDVLSPPGEAELSTAQFLFSLWKMILVRCDPYLMKCELLVISSGEIFEFDGDNSEVVSGLAQWASKAIPDAQEHQYVFLLDNEVPFTRFKEAIKVLKPDFVWMNSVNAIHAISLHVDQPLAKVWSQWCAGGCKELPKVESGENRIIRSFLSSVCHRSCKYRLDTCGH